MTISQFTRYLEGSGEDEAALWLERWRFHYALILEELEAINPLLCNPTVIDALRNHVSRIRKSLEGDKPDPRKLQEFRGIPANLLNLVCILTGRKAPRRRSEVTALGEAASRAAKRAADADLRASGAQEKLDVLEANIERQREQHRNLLFELQEAGQKRVEHEAARFRAEVARISAEQEALTTRIAEDATAALQALEGHRDKAEELMGIIAGSAVASGYSQVALEARKAARIWEGLGVVAFVGFIAVGVWLGSTLIADGATVPMIIGRVLAAGGPLFVALYFFRRANSMRRWQRVNRQSALGLAALEPYLKDFAPETRDEIRKRLVDRFFQLTPDNPDESTGGVDTKAFKEVMEPVTELVKATKASK